MKRLATIICVAAVAVAVAGCSTTSGTSVTLRHDDGSALISEGNTRLHNSIAVTAVTYDKVPAGLNRANFQITSLVQREQYLQYRIAWYNSEGMEIDGEARTYRPLSLQGMDSVTVSGVAPGPAAVTSRIRIRELRASE